MSKHTENEWDYESDCYHHAYYLKIAMRPERLKVRLKCIGATLKKYDFGSIAFMGASGTLLAMPIAMALDKHLIMIRKTVRGNHSSRKVEGHRASKKYVIVDDLMDTGTTAKKILKAIKKFAPEAKCLGVLEVNELHTIDVGYCRRNEELKKVKNV